MLITYKHTQENVDVFPGDEAEVYTNKKIYFVIVIRVHDSGVIEVVNENDVRMGFPSKEKFFEAIADV